MKNSPAALSSPTVTMRPRRAICSRRAANARWLEPGAALVRARGTHTGVVTRPTSTRTSTATAAISASALEISRAAAASRASVVTLVAMENTPNGNAARAWREPLACRRSSPPLRLGDPPRRRPETRTRTATLTKDQAENEVERRVEVRLGRERDRASEQHDGDDDHERGEDHAGGVACPCPTTVGTGEEHGLLRQHDGADRSAQPERDDDCERRQHRRDSKVSGLRSRLAPIHLPAATGRHQ